MLAAEKTLHIKFRGDIPTAFITIAKNKFGAKKVFIDEQKPSKVRSAYIEQQDGELVDYYQSSFYKKLQKDSSPALVLKALRGRDGLTQKELAQKLVKLGLYATPAFISDLENNRREIGLKTAKALATIFKRKLEDFIAK